MTAPTPGPWMVAKAPSGQMCVVSDDAWICGQLFADNGGRMPRAEADANARLIAASPRLRDSLAAMLAVFEEYAEDFEPGSEGLAVVEEARKVLAGV